MSITFKKLNTLEGLSQCERLQKVVWGFNTNDIIPSRFMMVLCKHGGFAMGAFDDETMIGFVFGVPAIHYGRPSQHSHMLAVMPEYRNQNIGFKLKMAQRKDALSRNIELITWTFDPLQSKNAYLNLNKLGVIACSYEVNFYGETTSSKLHSGLGTDRLLAEWWIASDKVKSILDDRAPGDEIKKMVNGAIINSTKRDSEGLLITVDVNLNLKNDVLLFEIPDAIDKVKELNLPVALQWREYVQKALLHYFDNGYYINYVKVAQEKNMRRTFYVLERLTKPYQSMIH